MRRLLVSLMVLGLVTACLKQNSKFQQKLSGDSIVGGQKLKDSDTLAKQIVGVWDQQKEFLCTGTLMSENVVLTAAHCVISKPNQMKVIFGVDAFLTLNAREVDVQAESVRRVTAFKVHEKYESDPTQQPALDQNDLALVKFSGSLPTGYKPATLLKDDKELDRGMEATVAGYGVSHVDVNEIDLKKYSKKKLAAGIESGAIACDEAQTTCYEVEMSGDGFLQSAKAKIKGFSVTEVRLDESKGQGTCSGDSGGPAFIQKGGNYLLFGVTSRGNLLCNEEGVYTSASAHSAWIEKTMQSLK